MPRPHLPFGRLILGGHSFIGPLGSDPEASADEQRAIVSACLANGIRTFDTTYAPERVALGRALRGRPASELKGVQPILWNFFGPLTDPLGGPSPWTPARFDEALAELSPWTGVPHLVVHELDDGQANHAQRECATALRAAGRIARLGVWPSRRHDWENDAPGTWDFVVHPVNPKSLPAARPLFERARARHIATVGTSPFDRGWEIDRLAPKAGDPAPPDPSNGRAALADALLRNAAHAPFVDHVIVAMRSAAYVPINTASLARGPLSPGEREYLSIR